MDRKGWPDRTMSRYSIFNFLEGTVVNWLDQTITSTNKMSNNMAEKEQFLYNVREPSAIAIQ
jgi:hypothetical protein